MKPDLLYIPGLDTRLRDMLEPEFTLYDLPGEKDQAAFLAEHGARFTAVATSGTVGLPAAVMAALPNLKIVSCYGVGYDGIDAEAAAARGIIVTHTPGVLNDDVANTAIMLWLATSRKLPMLDRYVRDGRWEREGNAALTVSPQNRTVGIVGLGRIGQAIADRLPPFGARILYHTRSPKDVPYTYYANLTEMAREADVLIVITPGGAETHHLINAEVIEALGPEGILVNVARGPVVDETALIAALQDGRLGGAGLDVFEHEPVVPQALCELDNVVLQPHIASATVETRRAMAQLVGDNLIHYFREGTVLTPVPECQHLT